MAYGVDADQPLAAAKALALRVIAYRPNRCQLEGPQPESLHYILHAWLPTDLRTIRFRLRVRLDRPLRCCEEQRAQAIATDLGTRATSLCNATAFLG
jgi:hypothetical protein